MSSLKPPMVGKPPASTPSRSPKTTITPGLSDKFKTETSQSLEKALKQGSFETGLECLFKSAAATPVVAPKPGMFSGWKKPLALAGLGAAGVLGGGAYLQHQKDKDHYPDIYAPMTGGIYQ